MNKPSHDHDPELRSLLDSIGLHHPPDTGSLTSAQRRQAESDLARIHSRARPTHHRKAPRVIGAIAAAAIAIGTFAWVRETPPPSDMRAQPLTFTAHSQLPGVPPHGMATRSALLGLAQAASERPPRNGSTPRIAHTQRWVNHGPPTSSAAALLPEPRDLHHIVRDHATPCRTTPADCALLAVTGAFLTYDLSPAATATLWQFLARSTGLVELGITTDRLGRTAVGFAAAEPAATEGQLLADPTTGAFLGFETVERGPGVAPSLRSYVAFSAP